jgi:hypothetical protein
MVDLNMDFLNVIFEKVVFAFHFKFQFAYGIKYLCKHSKFDQNRLKGHLLESIYEGR